MPRKLMHLCFAFMTSLLAIRAFCDEPVPHFTSIQFQKSDWARRVKLGDLDGDGHLDALIAHDKYCEVWIGDGNGDFVATHRLSVEQPLSISLVDLDANSQLDLVINGQLWINNRTGVFSEGEMVLAGHKHPLFHDLDNDGDLDVVSAGSLTVHWNEANGQYRSQELNLYVDGSRQLALLDMDRDGQSDIVMWNRNGCRVLFNESGAFVKLAEVELLGANHLSGSTQQLLWEDFDGDDNLDIAMVQYGWDDMAPEDYIWLQEGNWKFKRSQVIRGDEQWGSEATTADFDQDGDIDLFVGQDGGESKLWLNNGRGEFSNSISFGGGTHSVAVGDVDEDGDLDIFTVGCAPPTVWINDSTKPAKGKK